VNSSAKINRPQVNEHYQIYVRTGALLPGAVTPAQGWGAHAFRVLVAAFRRNELPPEPCFHAK